MCCTVLLRMAPRSLSEKRGEHLLWQWVGALPIHASDQGANDEGAAHPQRAQSGHNALAEPGARVNNPQNSLTNTACATAGSATPIPFEMQATARHAT